MIRTGNVDSLFYVCTDHLGSITALVNEQGTVVERHSYDAWGRERNPNDWSSYTVTPGRLDRGFTGHEAIREFGLINMNGRVYDPILGRMLSPDNEVQDPFDSQSYDRYGYCINNPLRYTDPTGYTWLSRFGNWIGDNWKPIITTTLAIGITAVVTIATGGAGAVVSGMIGGFAGGAVAGVVGTAFNKGSFSDCLAAGLMGGILGGMGGALGGWTSSLSKALGVLPGIVIGAPTGALVGGITSGISGGLTNLINGKDFGEGFKDNWASGAIFGGIGGAIGGGIKGYQNAKAVGANWLTGYKIVGDPRTYSTSFSGNSGNFRQPDLTKNCYAYASAYSNPNDANPQDYIDAMGGANGSSMNNVGYNFHAQDVGGIDLSGNNIDFDQLGSQFKNGYSLYSTTDSHIVNITQFTVSDKMNLFFGGTHQIITNLRVMDPAVGAIISSDKFMGNSVITWIRW